MRSRVQTVGMTLVGLAALSNCGSSQSTAPSAVIVQVSIVASGPAYVDFPVQLLATASLSNGGFRNVTGESVWQSPDGALAEVSPTGLLTFHRLGTVDVGATIGGVTGTLDITSAPIPTVTSTVADRISGMPVDGSTIAFSGPLQRTAVVLNGQFALPLVPGTYDVTISGPTHVTHRTKVVPVVTGQALAFTVIVWGSGPFGAVYDERFHEFFDQIARVAGAGPVWIKKWPAPPTEIYVADADIPATVRDQLLEAVREIDQDSLGAMMCGLTGPVPIRTGPDPGLVDGRILIRPSEEIGTTATVNNTFIRSALIKIDVWNPQAWTYQTPETIRGALEHEFFHAAFANHECGGDIGSNPFGFSRSNCPFPDSVIANLGPQVLALSPEDKLAACLVYHPDTHVGNQFPDTNNSYVR